MPSPNTHQTPTPPAPPPRKRHVVSRDREGCVTCRKRHLRCDKGKPGCNNCSENNIVCEGYVSRIVFCDQTKAVERRVQGSSSKKRRRLPPRKTSRASEECSLDIIPTGNDQTASETVDPNQSSEIVVGEGCTAGDILPGSSEPFDDGFMGALDQTDWLWQGWNLSQGPLTDHDLLAAYLPPLAGQGDPEISSSPEEERTTREQVDELDAISAGINFEASTGKVPVENHSVIHLEDDHPLWGSFHFPQDTDYFQRLVDDEVKGFSSILPFRQLIDEEPTTAPHVWSAALAISALTLQGKVRKSSMKMPALPDSTATATDGFSADEHALWHYANAMRLLGQEFPQASPQAFSGLPASDLRSWFLTRLLLANFDLYRGAIGSWRTHLSDAGRVFSVCRSRILSAGHPESTMPELTDIFEAPDAVALAPSSGARNDRSDGTGGRLVHAFARMVLLLEMHNDEFSISRLRGLNPGIARELSTMVSRSESARDRLLALIRDIGKVEIKSRVSPGEQARWARKMEQLDARLSSWQSTLPATDLPVDTGVEEPVYLGGGDVGPALAVMPLTFPSAVDPYVSAVNYAHFLCARMRARTRYFLGAERVTPPDTEATALHICRIAAGLSPKGYAEADAFGHGMMPAVVGAYRWTENGRLRAWIEGWLEGYEVEGSDREGIWSVRKTMRLLRFLEGEATRRRSQQGCWNIIAATIEEDDGPRAREESAGDSGMLIADVGTLERAGGSRTARVLAPFKVIVHSTSASGWATDHYILT